jgi:hypothetical protein
MTRRGLLLDAPAILLGGATTLAIYGYRFGEGNHTIYLLDAVRRANPQLLRNDWFTTQTLQYHAIFGAIAGKLMQWRVIEPAFLASYLLLVVLFHVAWLGIARRLGGGRGAYLLSVVLYYLSAAGTGLGMYQFFQDSSLLPSNVANVAMLSAICCWVNGKPVASGACFGIAGLFHLNHALVGILCWSFLCATYRGQRVGRSQWILASGLALVPPMANILLAARLTLTRSASMRLGEFVDLYVRLRHPHHYDPSTWPIGIWLAFFWTVPFALWSALPARRVVQFLLALQLVALVGAGVWYLSEPLVQLSLYRFSIFIQLVGCAAAAIVLARRVRSQAIVAFSVAACAAMIAVCLFRGPFFGAFSMPKDDPDYLAICDWSRGHTPVDAVFLVPPGESSFRLRARRAIVVNYKAVPQLSGELREWDRRMQLVLALDDLRALPRGYVSTLRAIDARYASLSADQLVTAARAFGAQFLVVPRALDMPGLLFTSPNARYFLYDLRRKEAAQMNEHEIRRRLLARFGLRVRPEMTRYILAQLGESDGPNEFPIIAGDARTGVAIRRSIARDALRGDDEPARDAAR